MSNLDPRWSEVSKRVEEILNSPNLFVFGRVDAWLKAGADPELDIYPIVERLGKNGKWNGRTLAYFDGAISQSIADRTKPLAVAEPRSDRERNQRRERSYEAPLADSISRDAIDKMRAESLNKGLTVMSVTYQDAKRMFSKGWLTPEAAERFGL